MAETGGFRSQPLWMKAMLFASLAFIAVGLYRCSAELTPSSDPGVIAVERAAVDLSDGRVAISPDSLSALATRLFVRELREAAESRVVIGVSDEAWAVVRLDIGESDVGGLALMAAARSAVGGRVLAAASGEGPVETLREMASEAARELAGSMGLAADKNGGDR